MRKALALLALGALLSGCLSCPRLTLATVSWAQPGLYDALGGSTPARLGTVDQPALGPGLPFAHDDVAQRWPTRALVSVHWYDPPVLDHDAEGYVEAPRDGSELPVVTFFAFAPGRDDALDAFLAAVLDAGPAERAHVCGELRANKTEWEPMTARTALPLRIEQAYDDLLREQGDPYATVHGGYGSLQWPGWAFTFEVPQRVATLPVDDAHRTTTKLDDRAPAFQLVASLDGRVTVQRGADGTPPLRMTEDEAREWANETFAQAGLAPPAFDAWSAPATACAPLFP